MVKNIRISGKNLFHVKYISLSYRIRGYDARIQMNRDDVSMVRITKVYGIITGEFPIKNVTVKRLIIKILAYSAIKIKANVALLYSVLNPDTSSDSPSAKSNGVRLVSARFVINHKIKMGKIIIIIHEYMLIFIVDIFIECWIIRHEIRINAIDTSYETVWAILRNAPSSEYLEFEHHPAIKVEYTFKLDTQRKYSTPNLIITTGIWWG